MSDQNDEITYSNADGSFKADLEVDGYHSGAPSSSCTVNSGRDLCSDPDDPVYGTNGTTISYLMPAGSTVTIDGTQTQQQTATLKQLCNTPGADATCTFAVDPDKETHIAGPSHPLACQYNNSAVTTTLEVDQTDDVSSTDSVNLEASASTNIAGMVGVSIKAAYGHTWSVVHGFTAKSTDPVPPHTYGEIDGIAPMMRDTGNFTITMGNTTYHLNEAPTRSPRPKSTPCPRRQ